MPRFHILCICLPFAWSGRIQSRMHQIIQSFAEPTFACRKGMHLKLNKSWSDHHVVNPYSEVDEEQHFVLPFGLNPLGSHSGPCNELVFGPPIFDSDYGEEIWDSYYLEPVGYLDGSIEVRCMHTGPSGDASLQVTQYSCREHLPFSTIWSHDPKPPGQRMQQKMQWGTQKTQYEYAAFTCGDPFDHHGPDLLHSRAARELPVQVHTLSEALGACEDDMQCSAVAVHPEEKTYHVLDKFVCSLTSDALSTTFNVGDSVKLSLIARGFRGTPLDGKGDGEAMGSTDSTDSRESQIGSVLEKWSLDSPGTHVLVQFEHGAEWILPEHLEHVGHEESRTSWTLVRKIRARKVVCNDMQPETSCDVYSAQDAEVLLQGISLNPADCQQACSARMQSSFLLNGCCVLAAEPGLCALTKGEHFKTSELDDDHPAELASSCKQLPCSLDPSCSFGAGDFRVRTDTSAGGTAGTAETTLYFDFAHPLSMPFFFDVETLKIFHFTSKDRRALTARRASRLVHAVGSVTTTTSNARRVNLSLETTHMEGVQTIHDQLLLVCDAFGQKLGRVLKPPNLKEALASGECDEPHEAFETCLVQVGCGILGDFQPFAPPWFAQLPFDLVAWQAPAAFCCGTPYTVDQRKDSWMKSLMDSAGIREVSISDVKDSKAHQSMQASLETGSMALKKMLAHHIADEEMLSWLGQLVKVALQEFKKILIDFKETIDSEAAPELEISSDGTSFLQVHEDGDQRTPSGRRGTEVARWSPEKGAFLQVDPKNTTALKKTWNFVAAIPGAVFNYGLRPLWNFIAMPLLKWGVSLMKWILEHPRAALFISKFALAVRNRMCEKASWYMYGNPTESSVGAFSKVSGALSEPRPQRSTRSTPG